MQTNPYEQTLGHSDFLRIAFVNMRERLKNIVLLNRLMDEGTATKEQIEELYNTKTNVLEAISIMEQFITDFDLADLYAELALKCISSDEKDLKTAIAIIDNMLTD